MLGKLFSRAGWTLLQGSNGIHWEKISHNQARVPMPDCNMSAFICPELLSNRMVLRGYALKPG